MRTSSANLLSQTFRWRERFFGSALGCHLLGASLSLVLIVASAFIWAQRNVVVATVNHGEVVVDLKEAVQLVAEADVWRRKYTMTYYDTQKVDARVATIDQWLPHAADWDTRQAEVQALAESIGVKIVSLQEDGHHVGTRVGVAAATCKAEGSYSQICEFLVAMTHMEKPIVCHEIKIARMTDVPANAANTSPCLVTLSLRVPFAAEGSLAARLLLSETNDAG